MNSIKSARKNMGWTQTQLADAIGVKRSVISKYENGTISPSLETVRRIAEALNVSITTLIESGFGALDSVLPPNMTGANLDEAKVDKNFYTYLLERFLMMSIDDSEYEQTKANLLALAQSSGFEKEALKSLDSITAYHKNTADESELFYKMYHTFFKMNVNGQKKVTDYVQDLAEIPRYQKEPETFPQAPPHKKGDTTPEE